MRLLLRAGLAAAAAVTLVASPASASAGKPVIGDPGGECDGAIDWGCYENDPNGPHSCTAYVAGNCILEWAP